MTNEEVLVRAEDTTSILITILDTESIDGMGVLSGMATFPKTLQKGNDGQGYSE